MVIRTDLKIYQYCIFFLIDPGKEKDDLITIIQGKINEQVEFCISNDLETEIFGKKIKFQSNIKETQIDHKVRTALCGGGGMFCTCCPATKGLVL